MIFIYLLCLVSLAELRSEFGVDEGMLEIFVDILGVLSWWCNKSQLMTSSRLSTLIYRQHAEINTNSALFYSEEQSEDKTMQRSRPLL